MTLFLLHNISPHFPSLEGDGEVLWAANRADVQPAKEAANPGEGSPGTHIQGKFVFHILFPIAFSTFVLYKDNKS